LYNGAKELPMTELTQEYDDSPWTREELEALAWEMGKHAGWNEMDEYDDIAE
jgi:hypothetical protein